MNLKECFCATLPNFKNNAQSIQNGRELSGNNLRDSCNSVAAILDVGGGGNFDHLQN